MALFLLKQKELKAYKFTCKFLMKIDRLLNASG
nr:MAG TPA: hypothetical protein [Caudoviricetes sp.]